MFTVKLHSSINLGNDTIVVIVSDFLIGKFISTGRTAGNFGQILQYVFGITYPDGFNCLQYDAV